MASTTHGRDIVAIGASAGGINALLELNRYLPATLPAAVFVVVHISAESPSILPTILNRSGGLPAAQAVNGESIHHGRIYVAPADHHLLVKRDFIRLSRGPQENGFRPAVDPLFRTAARAYGRRVIGVVLSGGLDDGTYGLMVVKREGGIAIAQDPDEAMVPSMPQSAIEKVDVDHILGVRDLATMIAYLASQTVEEGADEVAHRKSAPPDVAEVGIAALKDHNYGGPPSRYTCPECGGALWEFNDGQLTRYQCHVGHAYTERSLDGEQADRVEDALWTALRALEEHADMRRRLARRSSHAPSAKKYQHQAEDAERRADVVRRALLGNGPEGGHDEPLMRAEDMKAPTP